MEEKKRFKVYKIIMLVVLVAFITFLLTSIGMYQHFANEDKITIISDKDEISTALNKYKALIDKNFLGEVDEEKLKEGAIKGYIEALDDPYTEYISKEDMKDYLEDATGNFVGIGIYMVKNTEADKIMVLSPIKGGPAEKAGILPGDLIISVNGEQYTANDMTVASSKIKGETGSKVEIEILRGTETKKFELIREQIKVNPVEGKVIEGNIGYIEFSSFDDGTAEDFKAKFQELEKQGIKSLIIDLRNNGGGIVDEALKIADYVLEKDDVILYEVDKNNKEEIERIKVALGFGDLSENSEYDEAKTAQAENEVKIAELENKVRHAKIIDEKEIDTETVQVGNIVKVLDMEFDEKIEYTIVGSTEVNLLENKISNESPLGMALLGAKKNKVVEVNAPAGTMKYKILSIKK